MTLKFMYFDLMARSLSPVLALELYDLEWEREPIVNWAEQKATLPFGQIPVLTDGSLIIAQTIAIGNYIAKTANRVPVDPKDAVISDMLLCEFETFTQLLSEGTPSLFHKLGSGGKKDKAYYIKTQEELFPTQLRYLEAMVDNASGKFTASGDSVGEIFLFGILYQVVLVFPTVLDKFPGVKAFYDAFMAQEKVQNTLAGKSKFGTFKQVWLTVEESEASEEASYPPV